MWLLVANLFFEVLIHRRTTRFLLVRILYSLMLTIPLLFIVGIVVHVVKLVRFNIFIMYCKYNLHSNNFCVYLFSLIKILQNNVREGNQNVNGNTEDVSKEEDDSEEENTDSDGSQKENTNSNDDWSSNIYVFKFGDGYYSFHVLMNIWFYFVDVLIFFYCIMHFLVLDNYGFVLVIWIEKLLGDLSFLTIKILEMISLLLSTELFCCK